MEENITPNVQGMTNQIITSEPPKNKSKMAAIFIVLIVFLVGAALVYFMQYRTLQNTKKELETARNELNEVKSDIASLEEEARALRDKKRKKDLVLFTQAFRDYKAKNGSYPTTEGSQSQNIYNNELSKSVEDFTEPTTDKLYGFEAIAQVHTPSPLQLGVIQYQWLGKCNPTNKDFTDTTSENDAAIRTVLESGETYCLDI